MLRNGNAHSYGGGSGGGGGRMQCYKYALQVPIGRKVNLQKKSGGGQAGSTNGSGYGDGSGGASSSNCYKSGQGGQC
jgi:hypothetical protein